MEMAKMEIEKEKFSIQNDNYVQIINTKNIHRLVNLLDKEKIYYGGKYDEQSRIFEPTLMHHATFDDKVMQEEIFGPILPVMHTNHWILPLQKLRKAKTHLLVIFLPPINQ
ncbi:MAG: aldehyde dehydrogenase family protein [Ignavibacteria bacterium]|nr:aldehyde dehydrogenase family protein [Ignavibacteria bacterium]